MKRQFALLLCLIAIALPAHALQMRGGDEVLIPKGTVVADDLYVAGGDVRIEGTIRGDLVVAGGEVRVSGEVTEDLIAAGGRISVDGRVGESIRAAGGELDLSGAVGKDVLLAGGRITQSKGSTINGDARVAAGQATLRGTIGGKLEGGAREVVIGGTVGSIDLSAAELRLGEAARVQGPMRYRSGEAAAIATGAVVVGPVTRELEARPPAVPGFVWWLLLGFAGLMLGAILIALIPQAAERSTLAIRRAPGWALLFGIAVFFGIPVLATVLMITVVGIPLGLMVLALYPAALMVGWLYAATTLGLLVLTRFSSRASLRGRLLMSLVLGIILLILLQAIPGIGWLLGLVASLLGMGGIVMAIARSQGAHPPAP